MAEYKKTSPVPCDGADNAITRFTAADALPELVSVTEAAAFLGVRPCSIYSLCAGGGLPRVFVGRRVRIPREALAAVARGERNAVNPSR